jgi:crossover junction endodeoxyribonuclease RusA
MAEVGGRPYTGPVVLRLSFVLPRPKSAPKARVLPATKRPDCDKLARACFDAMSGVCYLDDAQVVDFRASKQVALYGDGPGCYITVTEGQ